MIFQDCFDIFFWKGPNLKACNIHCKLLYILKVGKKQESITVSFTTYKTQLQKSLQQNHRVWGQLLLQNGPWASSRQSQSLPWQPPGSPKTSWGSLCESCLAPPCPSWEPLAAPWHCLGASKSYFGSLGTPNVRCQNVLGPRIRLKIEDLSVMLLISTILSCLGFVFPYVFCFMDFLAIKLLNCWSVSLLSFGILHLLAC